MDESKFEHLAALTLDALEEALAEVDETVDVQLSMGVLTVSFEDGTKMVINSHRAARQIWMSADARAWHFDPVDGAWISAKDGAELWSLVQDKTSKRLGRPLSLRPA